jgi:hypothetical protein
MGTARPLLGIAGLAFISIPFFALVARLAEHCFNLMRVIHSTSSDYSYAVGGYFVGSMPGWFVVRLGDRD